MKKFIVTIMLISGVFCSAQSNWEYKTYVDEMTDRLIKGAAILSTNTTCALTLGEAGVKLEVAVWSGGPQIVPYLEVMKVFVRFDTKKAFYMNIKPLGTRTDCFILVGTDRWFLNELKKSKKLKIKIWGNGGDSVVLRFNTAGLNLQYLK